MRPCARPSARAVPQLPALAAPPGSDRICRGPRGSERAGWSHRFGRITPAPGRGPRSTSGAPRPLVAMNAGPKAICKSSSCCARAELSGSNASSARAVDTCRTASGSPSAWSVRCPAAPVADRLLPRPASVQWWRTSRAGASAASETARPTPGQCAGDTADGCSREGLIRRVLDERMLEEVRARGTRPRWYNNSASTNWR